MAPVLPLSVPACPMNSVPPGSGAVTTAVGLHVYFLLAESPVSA